MARTLLGTQLHPEDRKYVLAAYLHRYTGNHTPDWVRRNRKEGKETPLQFANDQDWLAHTEFAVNKDGRLDQRFRYCESKSTWPNNPELRK